MKFIILIFILVSCNTSETTNKKTDLDNIIQKTLIVNTIKSERANILNNEAVELGKNGFSEESEKKLLKALLLENDNPTILNNLGIVNSHLKNRIKAIEYYQHSLKISDSTELLAGANLSMEYYHTGNYQKGIEISNYVLQKSKERILLINASTSKIYNLIALNKCIEAKTELEYIKNIVTENDNLNDLINSLYNKSQNCKSK